MKLLILAEKPSQYRNYVKDLGGKKGTFNGDEYEITHALGHLLELKSPDEQVDDTKLKQRYGDWSSLNNFPWNVMDFAWRKQVIPKTKKVLTDIKRAAKGKDGIVIATDNDPSGEGDLLAWEVINAIGWHKKVFREYHSDETKAGFTKALKAKEDISVQNKQGRYLKAVGRERFDFSSMQLTRIATILAREAGYNVKVLRMGRLKSVIIALVYQQTLARENYVKKPFYEVRYQDDNGNVLKRTFKDGDNWRFPTRKIAENDMTKNYMPDSIVVDSQQVKHREPPKLLNLTELSIILGRKGYSNGAVLNTYQTMYQDEVVSYPRTEDTAVTIDQYKELLPKRNQIAKVVGVNPAVLTHLQPRKKHIVKVAAHGANRPGMNVPSSLNEVEKKYGKLGREIYNQVARSYLAILCEDYVYIQQKAHMASHAEFIGTTTIPKEMNYRAIFNEESIKDKSDKDKKTNKGFAQMGAPFVYQGANPKPRKPTRGFILGYLERNNIGNASTQVSTLTQVAESKNAMLKDAKGSYTLTNLGWLAGFMTRGTMIANPNTTKQILNLMDQVGNGKLAMPKVPALMKQVVKHDLPVMRKNAALLIDKKNPIEKQISKLRVQVKEKATGEHNGQEIKFNKSWGGHKFTAEEIKRLLDGYKIEFDFKKKNGDVGHVSGSLQQQTYKGHKYWGFKPEW